MYEGTVLKLLDFGAIVSVLPGKDGLLHISQIAEERVQTSFRSPERGPVGARESARGRREGPAAPVHEGRGRRVRRKAHHLVGFPAPELPAMVRADAQPAR
mgnify:CR=1 FL=1